ncbi:hypothetical protein PISMIDRAFT_675720 [Pisolithus microcarpus 441]|uniref:Uncharacterized protein n=1 Tax=Pisolithus microcarpus 441 TaxID=765257 RepID=A0A0D0A3Z7_9AGAM|nr:hypothetical protein PISMIDRAFT_675720 [Pisolithus microcarpus 441]
MEVNRRLMSLESSKVEDACETGPLSKPQKFDRGTYTCISMLDCPRVRGRSLESLRLPRVQRYMEP